MAMAGTVGAVYRSSGTPTAFVDAATTANATYTRYTITDAAKRYLDKSQAVTVKKNGVIQTAGFKIEYSGGVVVFDAALQPTDVVTVSGSALTVAEVAGFFGWKLNPELDLQDTTAFSDAPWKAFTALLKGWSVEAEWYWANADFFTALGTEVILVLYTDDGASKKRYEGYVVITKASPEVPAAGVIKESISFTGQGELYYREG